MHPHRPHRHSQTPKPKRARRRRRTSRAELRQQVRQARFSGVVCAVIAAVTIGVGIGVWFGNLGRAVKVPGEAYQTDDASGPWYRHVVPGSEARALTRQRLGVIQAALLEHALEHGGAFPAALAELVAEGRLKKSALVDGWEEAFVYERTAPREQMLRSVNMTPRAQEEEDAAP